MYVFPVVPVSVMLRWFVADDIATSALDRKGLVVADEVLRCQPQQLSCAVLGERVYIHCIRHLCDPEVWRAIQEAVSAKRASGTWTMDMFCVCP